MSPLRCRLHVVRASLARIALAAAVVALAGATPDVAQAQATYPTKPVRLVIGFAAGGPSDIIGRVIGAKLSETLGQQVYRNRGGAGGSLAVRRWRAPNRRHAGMALPAAPWYDQEFQIPVRGAFRAGGVWRDRPGAARASVARVGSVADLIAWRGKARPALKINQRGTRPLAAKLFGVPPNQDDAGALQGGGETLKDLCPGK